MIDAQQRRLARLGALSVESRRRVTAPGAARFDRVVRSRQGDTSDSGLEVEVRRIARAGGWRVSDGPLPIRVRPDLVLHADIALLDHPVVLEYDGFGFHRDRASFTRDRERWALFQEAGRTIVWVTYDLLDHSTALLDRIATAVGGTAGTPVDPD